LSVFEWVMLEVFRVILSDVHAGFDYFYSELRTVFVAVYELVPLLCVDAAFISSRAMNMLSKSSVDGGLIAHRRCSC
jgi:hypothetical protein